MKELDSTLIRNFKGGLVTIKSHTKEYVDLIKPEFFDNNLERKKLQKDAINHAKNIIGEGPYEILEIFEYINIRKNKPYNLLTLVGKENTTMQFDKRFFYKI